jgi:acyl-CoA reductase-like NAD-dependent aldehyde dehydrogenase
LDSKTLHVALSSAAETFSSRAIDRLGGPDPVAMLYGSRRASYSLFSLQLSDADCESLRPYLFGRPIPEKPGDAPLSCLNFVDGEWVRTAEMAPMHSLADKRVTLSEIARSRAADCTRAVDAAHAYWTSLDWAREGLAYRKHVVKNFARLLHYFYKESIFEIRQVTPKTRLEADKDFWEAKRAADHLEGNVETAMRGHTVPTMVAGQAYWRDAYVPAGVCTLITPMNFVYGIPAIQLIGCYLSGSPLVLKGHPFSAIATTTLVKTLIAAGADPRAVHKIEGFGGDVAPLVEDARVTVVSVTGSVETAKKLQAARRVRTVRFEGGGCNWCWVDDGFTDDELRRMATRLAYSKAGLGSHKCTTLHGIAASASTLDRLEPMIVAELRTWKVADPRHAPADETKVVSPVMVHAASTVTSIQEGARAAGVRVLLEGGKVTGSDYADNTEAAAPVVLGRVTPGTVVDVSWDGASKRVALATTEFFMPILVTMEMPRFEGFVHFCLEENPHDLATSIFTRDDAKLALARRTLGGMLKENDGTDSALEWEEFGASGVGESGNAGVGDAESTIAMFCRRQKGRHLVLGPT